MITAQLPDNPLLLECDAVLLLQLLDNLLENAIQFSPAHSEIKVIARQTPTHVQISVIDQGPGIPQQWKERVFDAFQRVTLNHAPQDASNGTNPRRGVGVGLAVCAAIAKVHGGRMWVEDGPQGGTDMRIELPLKAVPVVPDETPICLNDELKHTTD